MTLDQLGSFLEVAETGSFHRAANRLGSTQPTVSSRIKSLESLLGQRLFHRGPGGVTLTAAGHRFQPFAEIAVKAIKRGRAEVSLPKDKTKAITLGIQSYLIHDLGRHLVQQANRQLTTTSLRLEPDYSDGVIKLVTSGLADAGIVYVPQVARDIEVERLGTQHVHLVATPGIEAAVQASKASYIQVFWGDAFLQVEAEFLGPDVPASCAVGSPRLALDLILEQGGLAYLDRRMIAKYVAAGQLILVQDAPIFERPVYLVKSVRELQAETALLVQVARNWFDAFQTEPLVS